MDNLIFDPNKQTTNYLLNEILKTSGSSFDESVIKGLNPFDFKTQLSLYLRYEPVKHLVESIEIISYMGSIADSPMTEANITDECIFLVYQWNVSSIIATDEMFLEFKFFDESTILTTGHGANIINSFFNSGTTLVDREAYYNLSLDNLPLIRYCNRTVDALNDNNIILAFKLNLKP